MTVSARKTMYRKILHFVDDIYLIKTCLNCLEYEGSSEGLF